MTSTVGHGFESRRPRLDEAVARSDVTTTAHQIKKVLRQGANYNARLRR